MPNNASAATFAFTIRNEHSKQVIDVGKILTTNPSGTHGIPADKYVCNQMPVGGGSFQEYYDGGKICNPSSRWAGAYNMNMFACVFCVAQVTLPVSLLSADQFSAESRAIPKCACPHACRCSAALSHLVIPRAFFRAMSNRPR